MSPLRPGGLCTRWELCFVCIVMHSPPAPLPGAPDPSCESTHRHRGSAHLGGVPSCRQRQASMFSARTGNLCLYPPPSSPFIIPTLNCRVQESKTSLSEDQEALGWGAWLGYDRAGAPVPSPTREKGKIMLDKFRRTGPARAGLGMRLLLFDFGSQVTAGGATPGGRSCTCLPACAPPCPVCTGVCPYHSLALPQVCPEAPSPTS